LPTEIRSREENRKKYGVPYVKILERKKRVLDTKCLDPSGPLLVGFFFNLD
jgi:hypothetical protein